MPLLRKDFIIDEYQVYESRAAGADAIVLDAAHGLKAGENMIHFWVSDNGTTGTLNVLFSGTLGDDTASKPKNTGVARYSALSLDEPVDSLSVLHALKWALWHLELWVEIKDILLDDGVGQCDFEDAAHELFEMDEETFRALYDRTSRALWAYLSRITGSPDAADDLLRVH